MDVRDWREMGKNREYSYTANGYRVTLRGDKNVLELVTMVVHFCEYTKKTTELYTLKG